MPTQEIPNAIPPFQQIVLFTGNVMRNAVATRSKAVHKKVNTELIQAIDDTLRYSLRNPNEAPSFRYYHDQSLLEVPDFRFQSRISPEDRKDVEVTAKLFYLDQSDSSAENINLAVSYVKSLLGVDLIDNFIVSYTPSASPETVTSVWSQLEKHHQNEAVGKLGVAEFTEEQLERILLDDAVNVKPSVNQINIAQCGTMPSSMIGLAKKHNMELLYNGDRSDILDADTLTALLYSHNVMKGDAHVVPLCVIKYHVFVRCRSIVTNKGYIVVGDTRV